MKYTHTLSQDRNGAIIISLKGMDAENVVKGRSETWCKRNTSTTADGNVYAFSASV